MPITNTDHERLVRAHNRGSTNGSGWRPAGDRVLVQVREKQTRTEGGLYLPEEAAEREKVSTQEGIVVELGKNAFQRITPGSLWVSTGAKVLFARYGGTPLRGDDGKDYRVLDDSDIIAVYSGMEEIDHRPGNK